MRVISTLVVLLLTLSCAQLPAVAQKQAGQPGAKAPAKGRGQACNVAHAAKTQPCRSITGNPRGPWWVIVKEGAYKTCGRSDNPEETCVEKAKATHTIEIYKNNACTVLLKTISVDQARCD